MRLRNIISLTETRKRLFEIAEEVQGKNNHFVLTKHGRPYAVILSADDFEKMKSYLKRKLDRKISLFVVSLI